MWSPEGEAKKKSKYLQHDPKEKNNQCCWGECLKNVNKEIS